MNTQTSSSPTPVREKITLSRNLSLFTIMMIGVGGMIGAGIFVLTGVASGVAGPALILAFFLNGLVTMLTGMVYAELGSAFPEAGGGYLWVKEGLGGAQGFLSGWMSWFAHVVAGSLYALGFGRFLTELLMLAGLSVFGLSVYQQTLLFMTLIILVFTMINYLGASETGSIGNLITLTKIIILVIFILFGLIAMQRSEAWMERFTTDFMPNGIMGIVVAMGLTFIAFEGYEIIAQTGEEVINPMKNIPRAIFLAIITVVVIYIFVGITAIGSVNPPPGVAPHEYLGEKGEIAIVEVAYQVFPFGIGAVVLLISGLVSTMSALNATTYSSSRVSFAMGRDHNLPSFFARIHPKRYTPYWAVIASGGLMLIIAWSLPIEQVAAAADIMFLLLFLQVNISMMTLRHKMPDLKRGFRVPLFPVVPVLALAANGILAISLFSFAPISWYTAIAWIILGLLLYYTHFARIEAMEKPKEILLEEVLVSRDYSVTVPVATIEQAIILGKIGTILAKANQGEVLALHVIKVPPQLTLGEGRLFLKEGRTCLETVIHEAKPEDVPVHTIIRLGRNVSEAIRKTVEENASDMLVLGWPGYTNTAGRLFGSVIDPIIENPPTDLAIVRYRQRRPVQQILVPVASGPNSRRAVKMAVDMARSGEHGNAKVVMLHIIPPGSRNGDLVRAEQVFHDVTIGIEYDHLEKRISHSTNIVEGILKEAEASEDKPEADLIVIGATQEPLLKRIRMGNISELVARQANVSVIVVKRRSGPLHSFLRQTVLTPT